MYQKVRLPDFVRENVVNAMSSVVMNTDLHLGDRLAFAHFKDERVGVEIALKVHQQGMFRSRWFFVENQIIRYMIESRYTPRDVKEELWVMMTNQYQRRDCLGETRQQIVDIYAQNGRDSSLLEQLRQETANRQDQQPPILRNVQRPKKAKKTVYQDSQNVHNSDVNKSVKRACRQMILDARNSSGYHVEFKESEVVHALAPPSPIIAKSLSRIQIDTARFLSEGCNFTLYDVFSALWWVIQSRPQKTEMLKRLREELVSMSTYCSTGHLARLVNVVQGFDNCEAYTIKISTKDQISAVVSTRLNKALQSAPEEVMDSMIADELSDKKLFIGFVCETINNCMPELIAEYDADTQTVTNAIQGYTRVKGWVVNKIEGNSLQVTHPN